MTQKILITGGAGYIGSHVLNLLGSNSGEYEITVVDNLSTGRKGALLYGKHIQQDLDDTQALRKLMESERFDACFHFAGSIIVPESVTKPYMYYQNNTVNSLNLINLCVETGVKKFVFSSTAAVYGLPEGGECVEETGLNPINPYGVSKLMTEQMLSDVAKVNDLTYVALRYFNVAGANANGKLGQAGPNATHLIKIACQAALGKREGMKVFGTDYPTKDGTCIRDYIHVDDLAMAHLDALTYLNNDGKSIVLNCGYGHGFSVNEVIAVVKEVSGVDFKVETDGRRAGDAPELISVAKKIRNVLGWKPQKDNLELIVKSAYEWEKQID